MEYHYSDPCIPSEHPLNDPYPAEYTPQYAIPSKRAEYEVRTSVLVDGADRFGVSAVVFDKHEELIWMGNQGGHITSYYGPGMQKYTSFQIHETEEVRDIVTSDQGIFALTKTTLRHQIRRGIPRFTHRSLHMTDMQCIYQENPTKLLMGGHQDKLIDLDLNKMKEMVIPIHEAGCVVLRSGGGSLVACGSAQGSIVLRDLRSPRRAEHTFQAHEASLSDLDMQGDLLITCGFTNSVNSVAIPEQYVVVWDVRYLRGTSLAGEGAWSLPTASPPLLLHFVPAFSGRAVALSGDGHVTLLNVNGSDSEEQSVFQVNVHNSVSTVIDVAATSQALIFGDQAGRLHLFSPQQNKEPVFNNFSRATQFASSVVGLPSAPYSDTSFRYSAVPLPALASGSRWFNELPQAFFKKTYRKPKPIDPEVLKTMKMQGPIGYAPNPKTTRRNQMPYIPDTLEDLKAAKQHEDNYNTQPIPKHYLKMENRFSKHASGDSNGEIVNNTGFPGIETTIANSYCNSMLQVLYYTLPVKATLLAHTCAKEFCLSCELGFLFRMLDTSSGVPCQANNFLRAFRTVPEAAALGLILPDRGPDTRVDVVALIQSWNRFILHQIHFEILETRKKEKELAILANPSPPKNRLSSKLRHLSNSNGQYPKEFRFTELEYLAPTEVNGQVEFDKDETWRKTGQDDASGEKTKLQNGEHHELNNHHSEREESEISQLFAIGRNQLNRCLKCNKEEERESVVLACALQYPAARETDTRGSFTELIRVSLCARRSTPAWCERCARYTPTAQRGRLRRLPPILAINCGGVTAHEKAYWAKGMQKDTTELKKGSSSKPCRYGLHCARPGCRFKHPDRASGSQSSSKSPPRESHCVIPHQLLVKLQSDGDVMIHDQSTFQNDLSPTEPHTPKQDKHKKKNVTTHTEEEYTLSAAVVCVEDNPKNLVAYIHAQSKDSEPHWYMFNDLSIVPVNLEEVVQFSVWWKSPCVLFYTSKRLKQQDDNNS